ncbi:helix-turn-helix domain-containing protein [Shinella pollutisoli]|uniref:Helix-turn-helix domain-containing protein n=1 Tax=Shinella pollutisoli TaxID=2250594 RepID=A0ABV7DJ32_9HYPH|nr:helix-turn-helix domain-containing protein [Shinella pollutisoli]
MSSQASLTTNYESAPTEKDLLMGADAIAAFLGVTRRQVYRLVYDGIIPSFKLGGTVAARRSSLTKWMETIEASS